MALSFFDDKAQPPRRQDLEAALGRTAKLWNRLIDHLKQRYDPAVEEWCFAGKKWGWSLRVKRKKRAILYMTPKKGAFHVGFALGEKAVTAAKEMKLPEKVLRIIEEAPKYAEGRGVRLDVSKAADLKPVEKIAAAKMSH
jgi:hypothetical protein